ncbi:dihydrofolate reductase family protein [Planococcus sp. ISL-110]|nr:dihydrofolate reductase family protein [Planococcus sp. ISL-110]
MGANVCQQLLRANLADELQIAFAPVLLGKGVRFFEHLEEREIYLKKSRVFETDKQVEIWYKVLQQR